MVKKIQGVKLLLVSLLASGALISEPVMAWGSDGHKIVAMLAEAQVSPTARKEIDRLLAQEPGATLTSISTWADEHRNPATAAWHYVNFPRGDCNYRPERDCLDGKCVIAAIDRQIEVLRTPGDDEKRLTALKYVVHFIGDIHQPLHAGFSDDRGGNSFQLQSFMRGSNLHAVWDTGLIKSLQQENEQIVKSLLVRPLTLQKTAFNAASIAMESCRIVSQAGFYPDRLVTLEYVDRYIPVMAYRLAAAGYRLAQILNELG
ncbi:S1/P1 nuclease [Curvibacter sp. AEP1-3]|uniref:S1/P1 nuclease n=1 Tax=Curvibacter sp. AEP1-3 TaxID=1844971 RepID=UPI0012FC5E22|nr:S1/P1 nuclease [Curvibacter sp. AEP1-3]